MTPRFIKIRCLRLHRDIYINTASIHSISAEPWPGTASMAKIEYTGNEGYRTANVYVSQTIDEVHDMIRRAHDR